MFPLANLGLVDLQVPGEVRTRPAYSLTEEHDLRRQKPLFLLHKELGYTVMQTLNVANLRHHYATLGAFRNSNPIQGYVLNTAFAIMVVLNGLNEFASVTNRTSHLFSLHAVTIISSSSLMKVTIIAIFGVSTLYRQLPFSYSPSLTFPPRRTLMQSLVSISRSSMRSMACGRE